MKMPTLAVGICLLGLSFWANQAFSRPSLETLTQGRSAGFQGRGMPDPLTPPKVQEIESFDQHETIFDVFVEPESQEFNIRFMYQSLPNSITHLSILDSKEEWIPFLVDHPLLQENSWFHILDEPYVIYQRNITHASLKSLVTSIPPAQILTEQRTADLLQLPPQKKGYLDTTIDISAFDYLITTRRPQGKFGEWWWFRKDISIKNAFREADGTIYLKLTTTAPPFKLARQVITTK